MTLKSTGSTPFNLSVRSFQRALSQVTPTVDRRPTVPALGTVRIQAVDGAIEFSTRSSTVSANARRAVQGSHTSQEALLFPAHKLEAYARLLSGTSVSINRTDARRARISCEASSVLLATLPATDFPFAEPTPETKLFSLPQAIGARMLRFTVFAAAQDEKQPNLRGALLEVADGAAHLVTTDGHRLARYSVPVSAPPVRVLIPEALLAGMNRVVDANANGSFGVATTEATVFACFTDQGGELDLSHRTVGGQFPNYRAILPSKADASVRLSASALELAVRRCLSIGESKRQVVRLEVSPAELKVSAAEASTGEVVEKLQVLSSFHFSPLSTMFRGEYLLDALNRIRGDLSLGFARIGGAIGLWIIQEPIPNERFEHVLLGLKH